MSVNENTPFKLPIEYIKHNNTTEHIKNDLELNNTQNKSYNSVYHNLFNVSTDIGKKRLINLVISILMIQNFKDSHIYY